MVRRSCILVLVLTLAACSPAPGDDALQAALDRTLAADSFHIRLSTGYGEVDVEGEGDYVAPDRLSMTIVGRDVETTSITIGRRHYDTDPDDPGSFTVWTDVCEASLALLLPSLAAVRDADVGSRLGDTFAFTIDAGTTMVGEARVADGYLVALELSYELPGTGDRVQERYGFSDFNEPATVTAPPSATPIDMVDDPLVSVSSGPAACPTES